MRGMWWGMRVYGVCRLGTYRDYILYIYMYIGKFIYLSLPFPLFCYIRLCSLNKNNDNKNDQ